MRNGAGAFKDRVDVPKLESTGSDGCQTDSRPIRDFRSRRSEKAGIPATKRDSASAFGRIRTSDTEFGKPAAGNIHTTRVGVVPLLSQGRQGSCIPFARSFVFVVNAKKERLVKDFINQASWDRIARVVLGAVLLYLGFGKVVTGGWGTTLGIIGFIPLLTGLFGWCPIYAILKFRTNKEAGANA